MTYLCFITMNGTDGELMVIQNVLQTIRHTFGRHKNYILNPTLHCILKNFPSPSEARFFNK